MQKLYQRKMPDALDISAGQRIHGNDGVLLAIDKGITSRIDFFNYT
jgi:hypothetical protein